MNGLEADYADRLGLLQLAGEIQVWRFGSLRFHLGGGAWYKPDFLVVLPDGLVELHETKGHWREAARVRIKVAAAAFPEFRFVAVTKPKGQDWTFEEIEP